MTPDAAPPTASRSLRGTAIPSDPLVRELLASRLIAVLSTLEPDGSVHAIPMWFAMHGDHVILATSARSRKARNVERDARATLVVHDSRPGAEVCGVSIRGRVEIVRAPGARALVELVHRRYVTEAGAALPETRAFLAFDDVALRLVPERAFTWDERGNPASRALRDTGGAYALEPTSPRATDG
jgi:PPOX class probable F420-dependent enzyme